MSKWIHSLLGLVRDPWPDQGLIIHDLSELPDGAAYEYLSDVDACEIVGLHQTYVGLKSYVYVDDEYYTCMPAFYLQIDMDHTWGGHMHEWVATVDCKRYWRCKPIRYGTRPYPHSDTCLVETKLAIVDQEQKIRKWVEASSLFDGD